MRIDFEPLVRIMHRSFVRYLRMTPQGLQFPDGALRATITARIHHANPTRTLYRDKKPVCRSLDGSKPLRPVVAAHCAPCPEREGCTAQLNLQLSVEGVPYNLLLSFTSLKNFLLFRNKLNRPLDRSEIVLNVVDRGRWGELRFSAPAVNPPSASTPAR